MTQLRRLLLLRLAVVLGCSGGAKQPPAEGPSTPPPQDAGTLQDATAADATAAGPPQPQAEPEVLAEAPPRSHATCAAPPEGMLCIPGGPAVLGSNQHEAAEQPRHQVEISTFYLDRHEVTNSQYQACEKAKQCRTTRAPYPKWDDFMGPEQPVIGVNWHQAEAYCSWVGKRLPTEAEWEKAARGGAEGRLYPWGEQAADCSRAQIKGCAPGATKPVGSFQAGPYGIYDMAGNGYEWVHDWGTPCYQGCRSECGEHCLGPDPKGPCGGYPRCAGRWSKVLKGGSFHWPADQARGSWRRTEVPKGGLHRLSFRCASSTPNLDTWPPLALSDPLPDLPDPEPPSEAKLRAFHDLVEDTDIHKWPVCKGPGGARLECRENYSYVTTNEPSQHLWVPYIKNLGGGYVGIGADQAYSLIAAAHSRWAWLFDYDPTVVRLHYILRALLLNVATPAELVAGFKKKNEAQTQEWIRQTLEEQPAEIEPTLRVLAGSRNTVWNWYRTIRRPNPRLGDWGWLRHQANFDYVRLMYQQRRIAIIKGNLLTDVALPSITRAARRMRVPVRLFYVSNADDQWSNLTPQYRSNILGLPFDTRSVVLRTLLPAQKVRASGGEPWIYLVQAGLEEQRLISAPGWQRTRWFQTIARKVGPSFLIASGLPAHTKRVSTAN